MGVFILLALFMGTSIVGYKVLSEVPSLLHTPLMSGMNALSGVTILGALVATAAATATGNRILGSIAIIFAVTNVVGGFLVTHRMLKMFEKK